MIDIPSRLIDFLKSTTFRHEEKIAQESTYAGKRNSHERNEHVQGSIRLLTSSSSHKPAIQRGGDDRSNGRPDNRREGGKTPNSHMRGTILAHKVSRVSKSGLTEPYAWIKKKIFDEENIGLMSWRIPGKHRSMAINSEHPHR
jgi:hypothetical protein